MTFYLTGALAGLKQHGQQSVYGVFMVCQWGQLQIYTQGLQSKSPASRS